MSFFRNDSYKHPYIVRGESRNKEQERHYVGLARTV
jgi:hypothetical protein